MRRGPGAPGVPRRWVPEVCEACGARDLSEVSEGRGVCVGAAAPAGSASRGPRPRMSGWDAGSSPGSRGGVTVRNPASWDAGAQPPGARPSACGWREKPRQSPRPPLLSSASACGFRRSPGLSALLEEIPAPCSPRRETVSLVPKG